MSLIEKFCILFKTDAGELTKELDKAETSAQDLAKEIDKVGKVDTDKVKELPPTVTKAKEEASKLNRELSKGEAQAKRMGQSFLNVAKGLAAPVLAFASITGAVAGAVARASEIEGLANIADQSRIAVGDLDALGRAARDLGGDVNAAQNDIKTLSDKALEALANRGGEAAQSFKGLGLTLKNQNGELKNTNDILLDLADATAKMSEVKATDKLKKLGITDPGMIKLILAGKKAVLEHVEAQKKASEITEQQVEAARKYKAAQNEFSDATTGVANELVGLLLPSITSIVKGLTSFIGWCKEHRNVVVGFFSAIALIVTAAYLPAMVSAAAATLAATWPLLAIIAACAAFALVLEDVLAYLNGQPSLLGDLAAKYPLVADALKLIGDAWEYIKSRAEPVIDFLKSVWGMIVSAWNGDLDGFKENFFAAWEAIKTFFSNVVGDWQTVLSQYLDMVIPLFKNAFNAAFDGIKQAWSDMWEGFKGIVGIIVKWIKGKLWDMLPNWAKRWLGASDEEKEAAKANIEAPKQVISYGSNRQNGEVYGNALEFQPQLNTQNGVQRVDNNVVPGLNPVAPSTVQPAQNQIRATATTPIPANPVQKQEVKKEINVDVAPTTINIKTEMPAEAIDAEFRKREGKWMGAIRNAAANVADGVAR